MAPEQCLESGQVDAKADVYMLGVMLYEMVCGQRPFLARVAVELMTQHVRDEPPPVKGLAPDAPEALVALIHAMLLKDPEERPTMVEVAERLGRLSKKALAKSGSPSSPSPVTAPLPSLSSAPSLVSAALGPRQARAFGVLRALLLLGVAMVVAALTSAVWWRASSRRASYDAPRAAAPLPPRQAQLPPVFALPGPEPATPIVNAAPAPRVAKEKEKESKPSLDININRRPAVAPPKEAHPSAPPRTLLFEDLPPLAH